MTSFGRREFLKTTALAGAAVLLNATSATVQAATPFKPPEKMRGVNLGGWLVLEKWITPSLYAGVAAEDEFTLCETLGKAKAAERLQKHREHWITVDDFRWLAARGLNSVRLPVGYGILEENPPFISGRESLEWAFRTAQANGLGVLLDLHGLPGSQNGWDHSGRQGALGWHTSPANLAHSLRVIEGLAEFCKSRENLLGVELVNEPHWDVPLDTLRPFYQEAYQRVRKHLPPERAAVVFHDGFRATQWGDFMRAPDYKNVILDTHLYQCFSDEDRRRNLQGQVELAVSQRRQELDGIRKSHRVIVGEWSCSLPAESTRGANAVVTEAALHAFGAAQLLSYETTEGWFFWTYRTESSQAWNFRHCVERGWLPDKYNS
jgi:glucan 1,3-beta-glucosidase